MRLSATIALVTLFSCGAPPELQADAGQPFVMPPADAGTQAADPFEGAWRFSGAVENEPIEFTLAISRATDGNYLGQLGTCVLPMEKLSAATLRTAAVVCDFTEGDLSTATYHGLRPAFGGTLSLNFVAGAQVQLVAGVLSVSGTVINQHFPNAPRPYTFTARPR